VPEPAELGEAAEEEAEGKGRPEGVIVPVTLELDPSAEEAAEGIGRPEGVMVPVLLELELEGTTTPALLVGTLLGVLAEPLPDADTIEVDEGEDDGEGGGEGEDEIEDEDERVVLVPGLEGLAFTMVLLEEMEDCCDEIAEEAIVDEAAMFAGEEVCDEEVVEDEERGICDEEGELERMLVEVEA